MSECLNDLLTCVREESEERKTSEEWRVSYYEHRRELAEERFMQELQAVIDERVKIALQAK